MQTAEWGNSLQYRPQQSQLSEQVYSFVFETIYRGMVELKMLLHDVAADPGKPAVDSLKLFWI